MGVGDYIDDYCSRCKLTTDHSVAAMAGDEPVKVICPPATPSTSTGTTKAVSN